MTFDLVNVVSRTIHIGKDQIDKLHPVLLLVSPSINPASFHSQAIAQNRLMQRPIPPLVFLKWLNGSARISAIGQNINKQRNRSPTRTLNEVSAHNVAIEKNLTRSF